MSRWDFNHWPPPREPVTVEGDLAFVLRSFGMPEDMDAKSAEQAFSDYAPRVISLTGKACQIYTWTANTAGERTTYTVKAIPIDAPPRAEAKPPTDPWVKVGTTTIDGTIEQVGGFMLNNGKPSTLRPDTIEEFIDGRVKSQEPLRVGSRWLRLVGSHINSHTGTAIIHCDIVRRQSEIDAEQRAELNAMARRLDDEELADYLAAPCLECGPHGNAGRVLLLESWVDCTTCRPAIPSADVSWENVKPDDFGWSSWPVLGFTGGKSLVP